jgi:hypothetical protein
VAAGNDPDKLLKGISGLRPPACQAVKITYLKEIVLFSACGKASPALI